jgi:antitoxin ParD1/3/4
MNISLEPEVLRFAEEKVRTGQYASLEEAVNALLSHARDQEELGAEDLADLREEVDVGLAEADRGELVEFTAEEIILERRAKMAVQRKAE